MIVASITNTFVRKGGLDKLNELDELDEPKDRDNVGLIKALSIY